jgi:hypothetical protein
MARHVAGEVRVASAIGGEGERTLSERDRSSACYGIVGGAVLVRHSQFAHLHSALHACRNLVHLCSRCRHGSYIILQGKG